MLRFNGYRFYEIGMKLHPILKMTVEAKYADWFFLMFDVRNDLINLLKEMPLRVCKPDCN